MRVLVSLLSVLVLFGSVGGVDAKKRSRQSIVIADYSSPAWDGVVAQVVQDFNTVMPSGGPRLHYVRHDPVLCAAIKNLFRGPIKVCSMQSTTQAGSGGMGWHTIWLSDEYTGEWYDQFRARSVCHEMMHALTGVRDNEGALPDQSCIWGSLSQPGAFDIDLLRDQYRRR
jgi:hypothetical protein